MSTPFRRYPELDARAYRQELLPFLRTAVPIIGAQLSFMGMGVVDTLYAGRLGGQALAAIAVGSPVSYTHLTLPTIYSV